MGLGLLLVPALGGYLFLSLCNITRYRAEHLSGYRIVLEAACAGVGLFLIARLMAFATTSAVPDFGHLVGCLWRKILPIEHSGTMALSVAAGWLAAGLLNQIPRWNRKDMRRRAAEEHGDVISLTVDDAIEQDKLVEISLKEGKSYIGRPYKGIFGIRDRGDVAILPVMSGYRDKNTGNLEITVYYVPIIKSLAKQSSSVDPADFRVAIPVREVVSARIFSPAVFREFRNQA